MELAQEEKCTIFCTGGGGNHFISLYGCGGVETIHSVGYVHFVQVHSVRNFLTWSWFNNNMKKLNGIVELRGELSDFHNSTAQISERNCRLKIQRPR